MIRNVCEKDYDYVIRRVDEWWSGRRMAAMLPRLFFKHFSRSSFTYEDAGKVQGFLIGFLSDTRQGEAYVHFVGVDPSHRQGGVAASLYEAFFSYCQQHRVSLVSCVTSPVNRVSIAFHHRLGFKATSYDVLGEPIPLQSYDGPEEDRILFSKTIGKPSIR